jgi:hypothetical protein
VFVFGTPKRAGNGYVGPVPTRPATTTTTAKPAPTTVARTTTPTTKKRTPTTVARTTTTTKSP